MSKAVKYLPYLVVIICLIVSATRYYSFINNFAFGDLHIKIQGARDMAEDSSAYFYHNKRVDTLTTQQPAVTGLTSTPFVTYLHTPFINLTRCDSKKIYFWIEYFLFFCCFTLVIYLTKSVIRRYIQCASLLLFFLFSRYFFFHLDGQVYVLYALFFLILMALLSRGNNFMFGVVFALAIFCRPVFILTAPLFLLYYNKQLIKGLIAGIALLAVFTVFTHTVYYWKEYQQSMKLYSYENPHYFNKQEPFKKIIAIKAAGNCYEPVDWNKIFALRGGRRKPGLLYPLQSYLLNNKITITNTLFYSLITLAITAAIIFLMRKKYKSILPYQLMAASFIFYIVADVCIPAPRGDYNFIIWMFGAFVVIAYGNRLAAALMLLGLVLNHTYPSTFWLGQYGEGIMLIACLIVVFTPAKNNIIASDNRTLLKQPKT